jgi:hypothetical protein
VPPGRRHLPRRLVGLTGKRGGAEMSADGPAHAVGTGRGA